MRNSRLPAHLPRKKRRYAGIILFVILLGAAAYFVGAGAAGGWLAENVINPVFNNENTNAEDMPQTQTPETNDSTQNPTPSQTIQAVSLPETSGTQTEENISAEKIMLYTLQTGAFTEEKNAKDAASEVILRGGAGFVAYDGEFYRVLVAGYTKEIEAKSVKESLEGNGITTSVFQLDSGSLEFKIRAEQSQIDAVKACFNTVPESAETLQQIIYSADKGEDVKDRIAELKQDITDVSENLDKTISADEGAMMSLSKYMKAYTQIINSIPDSSSLSEVDFSSKLKYTLINVVVDYSAFLDEISKIN